MWEGGAAGHHGPWLPLNPALFPDLIGLGHGRRQPTRGHYHDRLVSLKKVRAEIFLAERTSGRGPARGISWMNSRKGSMGNTVDAPAASLIKATV
jgi:hypothetical protein